ncbi:MAG: hypothetical protein ACRBK7_20525 [Acidimicrobiales bacterium]
MVAYRVLFPEGLSCLGGAIQLQLSALDQAPVDRFTESCDIDDVSAALWPDLMLAAIYLVGLGVFLSAWWANSWDVRIDQNRTVGRLFLWVAVAALAAAAAANILTINQLDIFAQRYWYGSAATVSTLAWTRWLLTSILVVAFGATVVSWMTRSGRLSLVLFAVDDDSPLPSIIWPPLDYQRPQFGISLSGGGIRSAAFSLGALSTLEETTVVSGPSVNPSAGLLGQADLISSVSGGGYAAAAWRIAVGYGEGHHTEPIIGNPDDYQNDDQVNRPKRSILDSSPDEATEKLFPRIMARRRYLSQGRGGLQATAVWTIVLLAWHFSLLLLLIGLVAWPIGRMIRSPVVTSADGSVGFGQLAGPGLLVLLIACAVLATRSFTKPGPWRQRANYATVGLLVLAGGLLTALVLLPWLVTALIPALGELVPGGSGSRSTAATMLMVGIVATVWRVVQAPLKTSAAYLGGTLLVIGLVLFGGLVSLHAASDNRLLTSSWRTWLVIAAAYLLLMVVANPDLWSMHPVYRRRLAATFANYHSEEGWTELAGSAHQPPLSDYVGAPGPKPLICAAAARTGRVNTGVPVISMTFEPDYVTVHPGAEVDSVAIETLAYERHLGGRVRSRWMQSVIGLAAISAAAVAPSLGRMSLGSTNALIAALNLRLGVWMPNPLYRLRGRSRPHMSAMFKEMIGNFTLEDSNLYVTDGGHWENLGLVELIRRRAEVIIAVDAAADPPHSFKDLREAIELALLECRAVIDFEPGEFEAMEPHGRPRPRRAWAKGTIRYDNGEEGRLLYLKSQSYVGMDLQTHRYSKEDLNFPHYSTANQFLAEPEFANLASLGRAAMIRALEEHMEWLFEPTEPPDVPEEVVAPIQPTLRPLPKEGPAVPELT